LALLLIDIDHFTAYNDRFGHAAGDTSKSVRLVQAG
jgi:diguanylate cyclase (GGDEF)-like protein